MMNFKNSVRKGNLLNNASDMEECFSFTQAANEAARCLLCHDAPCSAECPAGTDPGAFIKKLYFKNIKGAVRTVKTNNILGGVCGAVCPTENLCEKGCSRSGIDRTIQIGKLQRFLVEYGWKTGFNPVEKKKNNGKKIAVIGSGPAGLSCAAELAKEGFEVTVFEELPKAGGMLQYLIPEYRLNGEFLARELKDIASLGVRFRLNTRITDVNKLLKQGYGAVFISTGVWQAGKLNLPGSELSGVTTAIDFLKSSREKKVSLKNKNVAVMGGGAVAMDCAVTAKALGAKKVYVIYRRTEKEMPANREEVRMAHDNFVIIKPQSSVLEFTGGNGKLTGLKGIELDWIKQNDYSSSNLRQVPGTEFSLHIDLFIFAVGLKPSEENKKMLRGLKVDKAGLIVTGKDGVSTSAEKIFAGGDIARGEALVVRAVSDGKKAAEMISRSLL